MQTLKNTLQKIEQEASEAGDDLRFVRTVKHLDEIRQGDVYLWPFFPDEALEAWFGDEPTTGSLQLVPGTAPGSRHVCEGSVILSRNERNGRVVCLRALERFVIRHPEHADVSLPAGCYEVHHQRDFEPRGPRVDGRELPAYGLD